MQDTDTAKWGCKYRLEKRDGDINALTSIEEKLSYLKNAKPFEVIEGEDNCLLNLGITELWNLVTGESANHFNNANSKMGVGDSDTAADPAQTDLQAETNKTYKAMISGSYPAVSDQKVTFKSAFGSDEANYVWNEWVIKFSTDGVCLNRKVASLGTKAEGTTWTLSVELSLT